MAKRNPEPCFVLTLPLQCEPWQRDRLDTIFQVANDIKNKLIAYERKQCNILTARRDYHRLQKQFSNAYAAQEELENRIKKLTKQRKEAGRKNKPEIRKQLNTVTKDKVEVETLIDHLGAQRTALLIDAGFSKDLFEAQIVKYRSHYKAKGRSSSLVNSHIAQKIANSVWKSFESFFYKNGKEVHFSKWSEFTAISAKSVKSGIMYRGNGIIQIHNMVLKASIDKKDRYGYQQEALKRKVRFCSISRRWYANGWKYFLQLTLDGKPPVKIDPDTGESLHAIGCGRVGHDIGTQTLASCSEMNVQLVELADKVKPIDRQLRRINRAMDRSRRATNPQMFNDKGTPVSIDQLPSECLTSRNTRRWKKSKRYLRLEGIRRELYRKQQELREQQHHELANKLLAFGDTHFIEEMRFRSLAKKAKEDKVNSKGKHRRKKRFGKSISNKAPASFVTILKHKVETLGGTFIKVETARMKASQFNHITETYTKKNLSQRWNTMPDGKCIQRDLYSAFLIMNANDTYDQADVSRCSETYPIFVELHDMEVERLKHILMPTSTGVKYAG